LSGSRPGLVRTFFPAAAAMKKVPLDKPFSGKELQASEVGKAVVVAQSEPVITTLPNGVRVATLKATNPLPMSTVGVFVDAGSRHEDETTSGASNMLEQMAMRATKSRTSRKVVRDLGLAGGSVNVNSSREVMAYTADVTTEFVPLVTEVFSNIVTEPLFQQWELDEQVAHVADTLETQGGFVDETVVLELAHSAAYPMNTLGHPLYLTKKNLPNVYSAETLRAFHAARYTGNNMVVAAVGVEHDQMVSLASQYFGEVSSGEKASDAAATYTGGDLRMFDMSKDGTLHLTLSFESSSWHDADLVPASVLQMMMGGGGSFSAGGPGKGLFTRLYERVLNRCAWVHSATCVNNIYNDTGLFTLHGHCSPQFASQMAQVLVEQAKEMKGPVTDEELGRAKNQLKSTILMHLENRYFQHDDLGRQVLTYNKVVSPSTLCSQIDAVTAADIQRVAAKMLGSNPTVAAAGDCALLPAHQDIAKALAN